MTIRVLVVDDHPLFRQALGRVFEGTELEVVGEAGNGDEAIRCAAELRPDVVLMDLHMPGTNGVAATRALAASCPVLMLTISENDEELTQAIQAGARGYLLKKAEPDELVRAVRVVAAGQSIVSPEMTGAVLEALRHSPSRELPELSPRQREVLSSIAAGLTNQRIAERLGISPHTVKTHVERLYERLGVASRADLVRLATEAGLSSFRSPGQ